MLHSIDRTLTTHAGSLPRPDDITEMMVQHQKDGRPLGVEERKAIAESVMEVVGLQRRAGVDIVDDGEHSKIGFANYIIDRLEGLAGESPLPTFHDMDAVPQLTKRYVADRGQYAAIPECVGPVRYVGQDETRTDVANLKAALARHEVEEGSAFLPAASPGILALRMANHYYRSYDEYLMALADAMREEYRIIAQSGLILQLDCPDIPFGHPNHGRFWASDLVSRMGHEAFVRLHTRAIARATGDIPGEQLRLHLCWGNYEGPHHHDVPLVDVLQPVLEETQAKGVSFEAANPRHAHEWRTLSELDLPEDIVLMPGVVDTTTNFVEHPELVAERIERFAAVVGREHVIASTDCGFGTWAGLGQVASGAAWLKLGSLGEGARIASERLW